MTPRKLGVILEETVFGGIGDDAQPVGEGLGMIMGMEPHRS